MGLVKVRKGQTDAVGRVHGQMRETTLGTSGICRKDALKSLLPITRLAPPGLQAAGRVADAAGLTMVAGETALSHQVWPGSWCPLARHRARGPWERRAPTTSQLFTHQRLGDSVGIWSLLCRAQRRNEMWAQACVGGGKEEGDQCGEAG